MWKPNRTVTVPIYAMHPIQRAQHAPWPDYALAALPLAGAPMLSMGPEQLCELYREPVSIQTYEDTVRLCPDCGDEMLDADACDVCVNCREGGA